MTNSSNIIIIIIIIIISGITQQTSAVPVVYQKEGIIYGTTDYYDFTYELNLNGYAKHCDDLRTVIQTQDTSGEKTNGCEAANRRMLDRQCAEVDSWSNNFMARQKRQAVIFATVLGALGLSAMLGVGAYIQLSTKADANREELKHLRRQIKTHAERQNGYNTIMENELNCHKIRLALLESEILIRQVTRGLDTLTSAQRVTPSLLPSTEVARIWPILRRDIRNATGGDASFPFPPHSIYEVPASYLWGLNGVQVIMHMPLVREELQLYRRSHFPLVDHTDPPMYAATAKPYVATNAEGTAHLVLSGDDLAACTYISEARFCKVQIMYRTYSATCEGALFEGRPSGIKERCQLGNFKDKWAVTQTEGRNFTIYLNQTEEAMQTCADGTRSVQHLQKGFQHVSVRRGCAFTTEDFVLPEQHNFQSTLHVINHVNWADTALDSFLVLPGEERRGEEDNEDDDRKSKETWAYAAAGIAVTCTLANVGIFLILVWRFRLQTGPHRRRQKKKTEAHEMKERKRDPKTTETSSDTERVDN